MNVFSLLFVDDVVYINGDNNNNYNKTLNKYSILQYIIKL